MSKASVLLFLAILAGGCGNSVLTGGAASTGGGGATAGSTGHDATGSNNTTVSNNSAGSTVVVTGTGVGTTATSSTGMIDPMLCDKFCAAVGANCFNNCHAVVS